MVKYIDTQPIDIEIIPGTTTFTANDVVGPALTFTPIPKKGLITAVSVSDDDNEGAPYVLWLFDTLTTIIANNDPFAPVKADLIVLMGRVTILESNYVTVNSLKTAYVTLSRVMPFNNTFQGYLVTPGTPAFAVDKTVNIRIHILGEI